MNSKVKNKEYLQLIDDSIEVLTEIVTLFQEASKTTLIYGQKGILQFLASLFYNFSVADKEQINYYFTISESIKEHTAYMST